MKINSIAFFSYPVSDVTKARDFYEGFLGLKLTHNFNNQFIEYDLGDTTFAIGAGVPIFTPGAKGGVVAFEVDNLDEWVTKVKAAKITIVNDLFESPVCRLIIIDDPDKNRVMLHQRKVVEKPITEAIAKTKMPE